MTAEQKAATAATSSTAAKPTPEQGTEWIICRVCGYIEEAKYRDQPVSYTHLDVYKRQGYTWKSLLMQIKRV